MSCRRTATAWSSPCDVFGAFRRQRNERNDDKCRRYKAPDKGNDEILAGLLMRSRRESRVCTEGRDRGSQDWPYITLLRADCQWLSVQRLHDVEKTEHGHALESTGGENSELGSVGTSEWGSGDDGETVSFGALLAKEGRRSTSRIAISPSSSSSSSSPPSRGRTVFLRQSSCSPRIQTSKPSTNHNPEDSARSVDYASTGSKDLPAAVPTTTAGKDGIGSVSLPLTTSSSRKENCEQPSTNKAPNPKRSAGAQYSGPPVDQSVQTTALRLPRSNGVRYHVLEARPITPPGRSPPPPKTLPDQEHRETPPPQLGATKLEPVEVAPAEVAPRKQAETFETLLKPKVQGSVGAKWAPVHLRLNMDEIQDDADLGQRPTVGAAGGGAVVSGRDCTTQSWIVERADVQGGSVSRNVDLKGGDATATPPSAESLRAPSQELDRFVLGDGAFGRSDSYMRELDKRGCPLDLVSKGIGSLGERLANVGDYIDRLEQDMAHDREVVEFYHRQAVKENEAAVRDLRDALVRRRASHSACAVGVTKVPLWGSRMGTFDNAVPAGHDPIRGKTVGGEEGRRHVSDYDGKDGGGVKAALDAHEAVIASENELREARAILESIEQLAVATTMAAHSSR